MNFREAESYLLSLGNEVETMKLGLENIRKLLAALGDPHETYLKVQVAGTNGKGSVCAFLDSICREAGLRTGVFTSPHLLSITERVRIDGNDITEGDLARFATLIRDTSEQMIAGSELEYTPTFFEQITAIALLAFAESKVEVAILETGLGGRLDATTAANAEIVAITRIDLDHQEYLGDTIEEIAAEKAAIIRPDTRVVIGDQDPRAMKVIRSVCDRYRITPQTADTLSVAIPPKLGLRGRHQIENAKVAILLAQALREYYSITDENILDGLAHARHPGRLEFDGKYLFDGAHNVGGAKALADFLDELVDAPVTLVFGSMKGKDVAGFAKLIFPKVDRVILTPVDSTRSLRPRDFGMEIANKYNKNVQFADNAADALKRAERATSDNGMILVTGSLYLVGEVKKLLRSQI